ncbi:MAG: heparinase II/III domain-containing protein [Candidatus Latescibacterota bacterium]
MRKPIFFFMGVILSAVTLSAFAETALEPFTYTQNFESRAECGWASYPQWQDTAYDPNFRANAMVPGDPNISLEQKVTPYTCVDNYAGALKELDAWLVPGASVTLRYYIKTHLPGESFTVRLACGSDGKLDVTIKNPATNRWQWMTATFNDFLRENPTVAGKAQIKVNGLAALVKIPNGDPKMPIFFGLDDVTFKGARTTAFRFAEPQTYKLPDWKPYIPQKHYKKGEMFSLRGAWPLQADRVQLKVISFTDTAKTVLDAPLTLSGKEWALKSFPLAWPEGLYLGTLTAHQGDAPVADTQFTLYIAPATLGGNHPRLWFDGEKKKWVDSRLKSERFKGVLDGILKGAKSNRERTPLEKVAWYIDQYPEEDWYATFTGWFGYLNTWSSALHDNTLAWSLGGDREAGEYAKNLLVKISAFPYILHPWMFKRGHQMYYPVGEFGMEMALGYDLLYDLMGENERRTVREGMMRFIVKGAHQGYVVDDLVISNTSNWVAHITGGTLMCQAAMYGDAPDMAPLEPYFTGAIMKDHELIQKTLDRDGAYGEGHGYYNFSMLSWSKSLPALENVFRVDISGKLNGSYKELAWAGNLKAKTPFYFGDSGYGSITANYAWLLPKYKDPFLGWLYNFWKQGGDTPATSQDRARWKESNTFMDVLYETADVPMKDPFSDNPVKLFKDVGTTVFKSGWEKDDFIFVMRTGPFVNHQHIDQGSFWLMDRGTAFIEERHGSTYYDDPLYQPWYTQPVAHSTILIDGNHQSQRVGDLLWHIDGFDDYAYVGQFLDGSRAAFVSGDIGRLYWGTVKSMKRNVLYLKPRTLLMLDTVVPAENDADITLLYQTLNLKDIKAGAEVSTIAKDGKTLHIRHLTPQFVKAEAVKTPHYLYTLRREPVLEPEGMLTVTARTNGVPLVMANLLTTTEGGAPGFIATPGEGCVSGAAEGIPFAFNTRPGSVYTVNGMTTDAVAVAGDAAKPFVAMAKVFKTGSTLVMEATNPVTFETTPGGFKYNTCRDCELTLGMEKKPVTVTLNGKTVPFRWDGEKSAVVVNITKGDGVVGVK